MREAAIVCLALAGWACSIRTPEAREGADVSRRVAEIIGREAERRTAYITLDTLRLASLLAEDFTAVGAGLFRDKAGAIAAMQEHSPRQPIDSITSDSVRVRVYGAIAIVTGINRIHMRDFTGSSVMRVVASNTTTNVWHFRSGRWLLISSQVTFFDQKRSPLP